jgi:small subunit ribosomal protein S8
MAQTDPIADMLTRIRNACRARHDQVEIPASRLKLEIAKILRAEGYIQKYEVRDDSRQGVLVVTLKYGEGREPAIVGLRRVSKPGLRVYVGARQVPRVMGGLGTAVLSTPKGAMTGPEARRQGVGGEVLLYVW